jgi:Flp pilus assembly protein TadG
MQDDGALDGDGGAAVRRLDDSGAATVEFALVAPLLVFLVFGIIEFGWLFAQHLDVRHGAREGSRLVAVNWSSQDPASNGGMQTLEIMSETCNRMEFATGATVQVTLVGTDLDAADKGQRARVVVTAQPVQLTGLFSPILDDVDLSSSIELRLEKEATWQQETGTCP